MNQTDHQTELTARREAFLQAIDRLRDDLSDLRTDVYLLLTEEGGAARVAERTSEDAIKVNASISGFGKAKDAWTIEELRATAIATVFKALWTAPDDKPVPELRAELEAQGLTREKVLEKEQTP